SRPPSLHRNHRWCGRRFHALHALHSDLGVADDALLRVASPLLPGDGSALASTDVRPLLTAALLRHSNAGTRARHTRTHARTHDRRGESMTAVVCGPCGPRLTTSGYDSFVIHSQLFIRQSRSFPHLFTCAAQCDSYSQSLSFSEFQVENLQVVN